jgi:hypothetical protein
MYFFRIFIVRIFFIAVKHIFRIFTGVLLNLFLLNPTNTQNLRESISNCNVKGEIKEKSSLGFSFSWWYEN